MQNNSNKIKVQYLLGFNNKTHDNLIWDKNKGYIAYSV